MDGGVWWATVHGVTKSRKRRCNFTSLHPLWYSWPSLVAQMVKNQTAVRETWVRSLGWEDLQWSPWQPTPLFLPGESSRTEELGGLQSM